MAYIENSDYIRFKGINFARDAESLNFRVAANSGGSSIEVRLGSPEGKLVGSMEITGTGGWQNWSTQKCSIDKTTGVNDVYFIFKCGSGYLYNLNWWSINYIYDNDPVLGDCNADGKFSIADAVLLQKWLANLPDIKLAAQKAADLYEDDRLNIFGLCMMKEILIKK